MTISVVIPCYEMHGFGARFLECNFLSLERQSYPTIEVVVGDQSNDRSIEELCERWSHRLCLRRVSTINSRGNPSANLNEAVAAATGDVIKVLFQDDFLSDDRALERVAAAFEARPEHDWLVSAIEHSSDGIIAYRPFLPVVQPRLRYGVNTFGPPSAVSVKRSRYQPFDPGLAWMMDVEAYGRMLDTLGEPILEPHVAVVSREWSRQNTHELGSKHKISEELRAFRPRAGERQDLSAAAIHSGQATIGDGLADMLRELAQTSSGQRRVDAVDRLIEVAPIDGYGLRWQMALSQGQNDPRWVRAASILASYHAHDSLDVLTQIAGAPPAGEADSLLGMRSYSDRTEVNPPFPTRFLAPLGTTPQHNEVRRRTISQIGDYARLAGYDIVLRSDGGRRNHFLDAVLLRAQGIAALFGLDAEPALYLGRVSAYTPSLPLAQAGQTCGVALAVADTESELLRLAALAQARLASGGILIAVDLAGDASVVSSRVRRTRRPFLGLKQIFS